MSDAGKTSVITFSCAEPGASTYVDLVASAVHEITLNGTAVDPGQAWADRRIALSVETVVRQLEGAGELQNALPTAQRRATGSARPTRASCAHPGVGEVRPAFAGGAVTALTDRRGAGRVQAGTLAGSALSRAGVSFP